MKRASLFFIALVSAIATFAGLSYAIGKRGYYNERYHYYNHHRCFDERHDAPNEEHYDRNYQQHNDSLQSNY